MRGRGSRQNLEGWLRRKTAPAPPRPKPHAPAPTATTKATRASATTVTVLVGEPLIEEVEDGQIAVMKVPSPARILVIDDNSAVVDILVTSLGDEGHRVLSALTSDEGLKLVILFRPDLMSATHSRSGPRAVNWRSTRSGAGRAVSSRTVVGNGFRRLTPRTPAFRMSRATRLQPTRRLRAASSAWMRGAPYVPRDIR
jgi:hypothetical protein